ncbi:oligopeptide transporter, OPT family [Ignatzschineria larvae DSM 13226]|uniref:Oligopeptide transporter, OPT family n=1 Tax=Ignatzschineria larvae DSM 13226 TaxID=1111732 RepID=A0ABZ3BYW6_9GAMM|nr:oligopeptide transporter, OPT family [Ignatzschineria larvae]
MNQMRELTLRGMILGALITVVFTASNVYLGLKVGLTFSSAIPAAVISMAVLRLFAGSTILENNMVQTQASAAGTLSSIIFVIPGLLMIGYWQDFHFLMTFFICAAGGMLGVLFSIPLRHVMVVKSDLPYPEGVAAAEILKAGCNEQVDEKGNTSSKEGLKDILFGGAIAAVVTLFTSGFRLLSGGAAYWVTAGKAIFQIPLGFSLALMSAGYLVGIVSCVAIIIGALMAWGIAVPILSTIQEFPAEMSYSAIASSIWAEDVRFIGAGTLAIAAVWTLLTLMKPVIEGIKMSLGALKGDTGNSTNRTEQDLSPKTILLIMGAMLLILVATFYTFISDADLSAGFAWTLVTVSVIFAFVMGFLVAAASGYMAGLVGSSASPISGIGIVAITIAALLLLFVGEAGGLMETAAGTQFATALALFTTSAVIAIACISNDNLQDLKTGYLVHATPWRQQVALLIGCIVGAIVIAPILDILYQAYGFTGALPRPGMDESQVLAAPQATLMATISAGIFSHQLEWTMIIIGLVLGAVIIVLDMFLANRGSKFRLPALAVGMGIYLPPSITTAIFVGGLLSWIIKRRAAQRLAGRPEAVRKSEYERADRKSALIASGLIVGESLVGVIMATVIVVSMNIDAIPDDRKNAPLSLLSSMTDIFGSSTPMVQQLLGLFVFLFVAVLFVRRALSALK